MHARNEMVSRSTLEWIDGTLFDTRFMMPGDCAPHRDLLLSCPHLVGGWHASSRLLMRWSLVAGTTKQHKPTQRSSF